MGRRLGYIMSAVLCMVMLLGKTTCVYAAENVMQYQATDVETLIDMAENNVDIFAEDTGILLLPFQEH